MVNPELSNQQFDECDRLAMIRRLRVNHANALNSLLCTGEGRSLSNVSKLYQQYQSYALKPSDGYFFTDSGNARDELFTGVALFMENELIATRLRELEQIACGNSDDDALLITDDLVEQTLKMRQIFPHEVDLSVQRASACGLIYGWKSMLEMIQSDEMPLMLYSQKLENSLKRVSLDKNREQILLPTAFSGVVANYNYNPSYPFPSVGLIVESL